MAYLHCHNCFWEQDDFWSWKYNPITKFWRDIKWLWKPRWMKLDTWIVHDITRYTRIPVYKRRIIKGNCEIFSWNWLLVEFIKEIRITFRQKWWTWNSWKKDYKTKKPVCPRCKSKLLDID